MKIQKTGMPAADDIAHMDRMLRSDAQFVEFVSKRARESDLRALDLRIEALQRAKASLEKTPVKKPSRKEYKNARVWCAKQNWSEEEVHEMIAEYRRQFPNLNTVTKSGLSVMQGMRNIGQAIVMS